MTAVLPEGYLVSAALSMPSYLLIVLSLYGSSAGMPSGLSSRAMVQKRNHTRQ